MIGPKIIEHNSILVVRDDLLAGGSKRRALPALMDGAVGYVYASPVYGYAQIALAHAAREVGKRAVIFCAQRKEKHPRTLEAAAAGALVVAIRCGYMSVLRKHAKDFAQEHGFTLLPFGLDVPEFIEALADVARALPVRPKEVWCVAGSGCLSRALAMAWPKAMVHAVRVGAEPEVGKAKLYIAPEKFEQDAKRPPPFPSCSNYDAKAWQFIRKYATPGALFWNVAA
jgi:threonine dehydratase